VKSPVKFPAKAAHKTAHKVGTDPNAEISRRFGNGKPVQKQTLLSLYSPGERAMVLIFFFSHTFLRQVGSRVKMEHDQISQRR
jgi:hypothetical protein